jgi:hypothetical protein
MRNIKAASKTTRTLHGSVERFSPLLIKQPDASLCRSSALAKGGAEQDAGLK